MLDIKKILKGITIKNGASTASASTKQFTLTVSDSATINTTTTLVSAQTANRTITLPDADGTLLTSLVLAPDSVVITDATGALSTSNITIDELEALDGITGVVETRLDNIESDIVDINSDISDLQADVLALETDKADITYVDGHLGGLVFDQTSPDVNDVVTYDGTKYVLAPGSSSGANLTLSNLTAPTAVNEDLVFSHLAGLGAERRILAAVNPGAGQGNYLRVATGTAATGTSGILFLFTGTGTASGAVQIETGASSTFTSGVVSIKSGTANTTSGTVTIASGNGTSGSGNVVLQTGTGTSRGNIVINAPAMDLNASPIIDVADPTNPQDAATKNYVDTKVLDTMFVAGVSSTLSIAAGGGIGPFVNGLYDPNGHWDVGLGDSTYTFTETGIYQVSFLAVATAGTINANSYFTVLVFDGAGSSSYPIAHVSTLNFNTTGTITVPVTAVTGSGQITIRWNNSASSNVTVGYRQLSITKLGNV